MEFTKTQKIIAVVIIAAVLVGMYVFFSGKFGGIISQNTTGNTSTTTPDGAIVVTQPDGNSYTIEQVPIDEGKEAPKPIPDLNRGIIVYKGAIVAPEARVYAEGKIKSLQTRLKANPKDISAWIDLGIYQKSAGDYDGAVLSWKYAGRLSPTDFVSPANLGNLYAYFIKDNGQAEVYYKEAIKKGPTQAYLYGQLFEIYRDIFKDVDKAKALVNEGLSKIPNDSFLLQLKASLQ